MTKWRFLISGLALWTPALAAAQDANDPPPPLAARAQSAWQAVPAAPDETRSSNPTTVPGAGGRLQLALNAPLARYLARTTSVGDAPELDASDFQWGIARAPMLELGYGLSDLIVIGGIVQLLGDSNSSNTSDASAVTLFIGPKLDLQLDTATRFKPFFGVALGLNHSASGFAPKSSADIETSSHLTSFRFQARAGVRCFISEDVSLDLALTGGFETGSGSREARALTGLSGPTKADLEQSSGFAGLYIGVSAWPDVS